MGFLHLQQGLKPNESDKRKEGARTSRPIASTSEGPRPARQAPSRFSVLTQATPQPCREVLLQFPSQEGKHLGHCHTASKRHVDHTTREFG